MTLLTPKQQRAATLLAQGKLCQDVAAAVGVRPSTISRWKLELEFRALLNALRAEALEASIAGIQSLAAEATSTLGTLLREGPAAIRIKAVEVVLAHAGITNPEGSHWYWGIGPTTAEELIRTEFQAVKDAGLEAEYWKEVEERRKKYR
jgi:hypothetical protein